MINLIVQQCCTILKIDAKNDFMFNVKVDFIKQYGKNYLFNNYAFIMNNYSIGLNSVFKRLIRLFCRFYKHIEIFF